MLYASAPTTRDTVLLASSSAAAVTASAAPGKNNHHAAAFLPFAFPLSLSATPSRAPHTGPQAFQDVEGFKASSFTPDLPYSLPLRGRYLRKTKRAKSVADHPCHHPSAQTARTRASSKARLLLCGPTRWLPNWVQPSSLGAGMTTICQRSLRPPRKGVYFFFVLAFVHSLLCSRRTPLPHPDPGYGLWMHSTSTGYGGNGRVVGQPC